MIRQISKYILILTLSIISFSSFSQSKKVWLFKADYYYENNDFASALRHYHMVLDDSLGRSTTVIPYEAVISNQKLSDKPNKKDTVKMPTPTDYAYHQIAMCYRKTYDYERAKEAFKISADRGAYPDDYYYYANSIMSLGDYETALKEFDNYIMLDGTSDECLERSLQDMTGCSFAMKMELDDKIAVSLADTSVFNKGTASFAVSYWGSTDKVVFSSARDGGIIIDSEKQDSEYLLDLYWTERAEGGEWDQPKNFGRPLNSAHHEASGCFNNGHAIFFTRWSDEHRKEKHIYVAREIGMRFFESQQLDSNVNVAGYESINPYVTEDGKWMYFSSNRPGGYGGYDIWRIKIDEGGNTLGEAERLRKPVNSEFDERAPFYHTKSNTLFFSSDGHKTIGGLDIFKSDFDEDINSFRTPHNMGTPINSKSDDSYFVIDEDLRFGYLTSNREACVECDSLYSLCASCYKIFDIGLPELEFKITGYVYDMATDEVIPNATVDFKDISYKWEHFAIQTDEKGYYEHDLIPNLELFLKASAHKYFADQAVVFTAGATDSRVIKQDFYLEQIPEDEITIEGIEYDYDKATLRPSSKIILDKLVEFLELNNNLKIEIRSHTDERGSDSYNLKLSDRRAKSVVDYLIAHGIPMERLVPKGYGETMPVEIPDDNGQIVKLTPEYIYAITDEKKQHELHQKNRRTAFFVLEEN